MYVTKNYWNYGLKDFIKEINLEDLIIFYNKCTENNVNPVKLIKYLKQNKASKLDIAIIKELRKK